MSATTTMPERLATLEADMKTVKGDVTTIKADVKLLLLSHAQSDGVIAAIARAAPWVALVVAVLGITLR